MFYLILQNLSTIENTDATDPDNGNAVIEANQNNDVYAELGPSDVARAATFTISLPVIDDLANIVSTAAISVVNLHKVIRNDL